jgi:hypothetical protein
LFEDDYDPKRNNKWNDWASQKHADFILTNDDEYEEWYGPIEALEEMNEAVRRRFSIEGYDEHSISGSIDEWFEDDFNYMMETPFMANEQYAVGYIRVSGKSEKTMPESAAHYNAAVRRVYYEEENKEQEYALRKFTRENGYIKFHTFPEFQSSDPTSNDPFFWLEFVIALCAKKRAALLYCELGSIFKHPEFFTHIGNAKKQGVKVFPVRNLQALESAQRQTPMRTTYSMKGVSKLSNEKKKAAALDRHPILSWKKKRKIPTKRFKTYEHFYYGADPVFKFFLTVRTKDNRNTSEWKHVNDYDKNIARALNQAGYRTVEDHRWSKQLARKARLMIESDEFKDYCETKFMIEDGWEDGLSIVAEDV